MHCVLTDQEQWRLALGMMAADKGSGLTHMERIVALHLLKDRAPIPGPWRVKIDAYWQGRQDAKDVDGL